MRTLRRNRQKMKYAKKGEQIEVTRPYRDSDGNVTQIPTGEKIESYGEPTDFSASINNKLDDVLVQNFGIDDSTKFSQIIASKGVLPLQVGDVIWKKSEVKRAKKKGVDVVDEKSADYIVMGVADEGLNFDLFLLKRNI